MADFANMIEQVKQRTERNNFWYRLALVVGVIGLSALVAYRAAQRGGLAGLLDDKLFLAIPGAIGAVLFLFKPQFGLLAMVIGGLSIPFTIGTGTGTSLNLAILVSGLLIGLWVFDMMTRQREIRLVRSRTLAPSVVFVAVAVLAFLSGRLPWFYFAQQASLSAQLGGLSVFIISIGAFLLVGNQVRELRWLEWMTWLYVGLGGAYVFALIIPGLDPVAEKIIMGGAHSNSVFWIWLTALSFSQAAYNRKLHPGVRGLLGAVVVGALYVTLEQRSGWASGWLPVGVAIGAVLAVRLSRWTWAVIVVGIGFVISRLDEVRGLVYAGDNEYSLMTRLEAWRILGEIIQTNPILGLGPANYYRYTPLYSILGYNVAFNSHNNYIALVAQVGLVGLAAFVWLAAEIARLGWWLRDRVPEGFAQAYVYGALGGLVATLVAMMLGDWALPFIYNVGLNGMRASLLGWAFLGGLVALEGMVAEGEAGKRGSR